MAGGARRFCLCLRREDMLPQVIENGCDIILFSPDAEADVAGEALLIRLEPTGS